MHWLSISARWTVSVRLNRPRRNNNVDDDEPCHWLRFHRDHPILLAVSIFLISNTVTIGISVRKEIGIMKRSVRRTCFVRAPFLIEGILIGLVGAAICYGAAVRCIQQSHQLRYDGVQRTVELMAFMPVSAVFRILLPVGLILGMGIGLVSSIFTIRKHLKV